MSCALWLHVNGRSAGPATSVENVKNGGYGAKTNESLYMAKWVISPTVLRNGDNTIVACKEGPPMAVVSLDILVN